MEKIYLFTMGKKGYHYKFKCFDCNTEVELITGMGRYGYLGNFDCPNCKTKYFACNDDHEDPSVYISRLGEQPLNMFDMEGIKRCFEIKYDGKGMY